jgi:PAS domain S-box-containing protein
MSPKELSEMPEGDLRTLVQSLRAQQVELEEQNRELREAQRHLEELLRQLNEKLESLVYQRTGETRLLAEAVAQLGDGVLITDNQLAAPGPRIVFVNEAMCRITGYTADELIGQSPRIFQGRETDRSTLDQIKAELSAGRSWQCELTNYRKDGTPYEVEMFITPLLDSPNRPTHFVSIQRDVTQRKATERELQRTQFAIEHSHDAIFWIGADARVLFVNDAACRMAGYAREELLTKSVFDIDPDIQLPEWPQLWAQLRAAPGTVFERRLRAKHGPVFPVEVSPNYLQFHDQEFLCSIVRDVSGRKEFGT